MTRLYVALVGSVDTGSTLVTKDNNNAQSYLSSHLSTSSGQPTYAVDGMFFAFDNTGSGGGIEYFIIEDSVSIEAFTALLAADISDKDWNLVDQQNWVIEALTAVPGVITQGRLVMVDTGTPDPGQLFISDSTKYNRVLTNAVASDTDLSLYYRTQETQSNDSAGVMLSLASSSSVAFTALDIAATISSQYSDLGAATQATATLNIRIKDSGGRALLRVRKSGEGTDLAYKVVATVAAETGVFQYGQIQVSLLNGIFEYELTASGAGTADVDISVESIQIYT